MLSSLLVTGHEFIGINSFLFVALILSCLLIGGLIKRYNFHYLPESGGAMLFGLVCGGFLNLTSDSEKSILEFSPNLIFFVILPPIILDAGYTLKRKDFFANIGTITLLAVVGTVINNLVFGYIMFAFAKAGWIPLDSNNPLECLLFGAVISATDPVATLAMLGSKEVNAHPLLYSLVFGESVLNDAIAIVLYKTFEAALPSEDEPSDSVATFTTLNLFEALGTFIGVSLGSVVIGVGVALVCCFIFKRIDFTRFPIYEFTLVTLFAYLSYFMAEMMYLSGIMSLFFCSVCLAHYNYYNISTNAQIATQESFKSIAQICETFVFAYIGITAGLSVQTSHLQWSGGMIVLTIIVCLLARAANVYPLCAIANIKRTRKISFKMQIPLWFAGLRGAVAFALSLSFPGAHTKYVVSSTLMLVLFTTIVGGGLTLPLLRWTGMSNAAPHPEEQDGGQFELLAEEERSVSRAAEAGGEDAEHKSSSSGGELHDSSFPSASRPAAGASAQPAYRGWVGRFKTFDKTFMRRVFGGAASARGRASGVLDEYGAPVMLSAEGEGLGMYSVPGASDDPEEVALRPVRVHPGSIRGTPAQSQAQARFGNNDPPSAVSPFVDERGAQPLPQYPAPHVYPSSSSSAAASRASPERAHGTQSYDDELKSLFKPAAASAASTPASPSYQPPQVKTPPPNGHDSASAMMSAENSPDPEAL